MKRHYGKRSPGSNNGFGVELEAMSEHADIYKVVSKYASRFSKKRQPNIFDYDKFTLYRVGNLPGNMLCLVRTIPGKDKLVSVGFRTAPGMSEQDSRQALDDAVDAFLDFTGMEEKESMLPVVERRLQGYRKIINRG
jgi:hypothetical protein